MTHSIRFGIFSALLILAMGCDKGDSTLLQEYLGTERGIEIYNGTRLDLAGFYSDVLKVEGNTEIIKNCKTRECIAMNTSESFDRKMDSIRDAVTTGKSYGMDYINVPFIHDLLN